MASLMAEMRAVSWAAMSVGMMVAMTVFLTVVAKAGVMALKMVGSEDGCSLG